MKFLLLAGTLGALMLFAIVPSVSNNAYANIFLIDNFTSDNGGAGTAGFCDFTRSIAGEETGVQIGQTEVIDMIRECTLKIQQVPLTTGPEAMITVDEAFSLGRFLQESGDGVRASVILRYDGETGAGRSLGLDLTESDKLRIDFTRSDFNVLVNVTLIDGDTDSATLNGLLPAGTNTLQMLNFLLTDFFDKNNALNLNDIDEININFTAAEDATDWTLQAIHITMVPVGGSMMPADMTALLLAGAELNAIWILPAIAAIGIGAFVVTRKRK